VRDQDEIEKFLRHLRVASAIRLAIAASRTGDLGFVPGVCASLITASAG